jgi:Mg2+/Co2+ transporter CorB
MPPRPAPPRGRIKVVERFGGRRVRHRTGLFRRIRSLLGIMIIGIVLAAIVAAVVAVIVGAIALAIQHALGN